MVDVILFSVIMFITWYRFWHMPMNAHHATSLPSAKVRLRARFKTCTSTTWTTRVTHAEYECWLRASHHNLTPELLAVEPSDDRQFDLNLTVVRYPATFKELNIFHRWYYREQVIKLIRTLHTNAEIYHNDLHAGNIVVNVQTGDVRLIDFEDACNLADVRIGRHTCYGKDLDVLTLPAIQALEEREFYSYGI